MDVEVKIDERCEVPRVVIHTRAVTEEVATLVRKLGEGAPSFIAGYAEGLVSLIDHDAIVRIFTETPRVFVQTETGKYLIKSRLYEVEESLDAGHFVRISNTDIINLRKVRHLDVSLAGTIRVYLAGGIDAFVSRRYMAGIKQRLGLR